MKQLVFTGLMALMIFGCKDKAKESNEEMNTETMAETQMEANPQDEWMVLFDGSSFEGWHGYLKEGMPEQWKLEDGAMVFYPPKDRAKGESYNLVTLYDMVAPNHEMAKPAGEWNTCVLTVNHKTNEGRVELNGMTIVTFPVNDPEWSAMVAKSKFADWEHFGKYKTGKIGLQDHGDMVSYKNIKIKQL